MTEKASSGKTIGVTEVRNNLTTLISEVFDGREHLIIEDLGIPVAALIGMNEYQHYRRLVAQEQYRQLARELGREAQTQGLTEEQLNVELEEDRQAVYEELYGHHSTS